MRWRRRMRASRQTRARRRLILLNREVLIFCRYRRTARRIWILPRAQDWWQHISTTWDDGEWQKHFRMKRDSFSLLCETLRPWLTRKNTKYRAAVPVEARVAICLWRIVTNLEYRSIAQLFGVGLSTCCQITQEVITAINVVMRPKYIKHPSSAEFREIVQGFRDRWRFPQVGGCIDGTHIKIRAPSNNSADYYNRKGDYSIILQGVVDHRLRFWDINVGRPGKLHDARVYALSSLCERGNAGTLFPNRTERFEGVDVPVLLLGDSAYPLSTWLMKPYQEGPGVTPDQLNFNSKLSSCRMAVERAYGRLKGRFRCLLKLNETHITFISQIVSACCVLHNFCEVHNEEYMDREVEEAEGGDEEGQQQGPQQHHHQQHIIRDALCRYFTAL
ncbi:protein ANTAGONIST OF LIKE HETEROCHROMATIN PROTEIN 1-like [Salarias fasciatus]|nr:protein ANTAGONIST OF LIKE HETEROCHROMATIN PROTEIN 1-like [Salarias fasciatus]